MQNNFLNHINNSWVNPWADIYFVWLSHKTSKSWIVLDAFCQSTNSGKIISELKNKCQNIQIYTTNLVKWVPVINNKIRYPNEIEKKNWFRRFIKELYIFKPKMVFLFWKQVSDFVLKKLNPIQLTESEYQYWKTIFILKEHPSYIAVYKRKQIDNYTSWIIDRMNKESSF